MAAASAGALLLTCVLEMQAYAAADALCARAGLVGARWVLQALVCWAIGWQLMSAALAGARRPAASAAAPAAAAASPRGAARRRVARAAAAVAPRDAAPAVPAAPAAPAAALSPAGAFAARERARVFSSRAGGGSGGGASAINFVAASAVLEWPWEQVMAAQRDKARPPNDPLNPAILRVHDVSAAEAAEAGGVRVARREREIDSSIEEHVPAWIRRFLPCTFVTLRETLLSVPDARWAVTRLESTTLRDFAVFTEQSVYEAHATNAAWTQWTGLLDVVAGSSWVGKQGVQLLANSRRGASADFVYNDHLHALRARLEEMFPRAAAT